MLIGEIELVRIFIDKDKNAVIVPFTSHIVVALFIIFISIILSSLFIALAVSDISSMQREGKSVQTKGSSDYLAQFSKWGAGHKYLLTVQLF
jgi:hypothetical protein